MYSILIYSVFKFVLYALMSFARNLQKYTYKWQTFGSCTFNYYTVEKPIFN